MTLFVETEHLLYDMHLSKSLCRLSKIVLLSPGCVDANGNVYLWGPHLRQPVTQAASEALEPKLVPGAYITFSLFIVPPSETPTCSYPHLSLVGFKRMAYLRAYNLGS